MYVKHINEAKIFMQNVEFNYVQKATPAKKETAQEILCLGPLGEGAVH